MLSSNPNPTSNTLLRSQSQHFELSCCSLQISYRPFLNGDDNSLSLIKVS